MPPTDYDRFRVEPITPHLGAEVRGVDMRDADDELVSLLRQAWLDWKMLGFRDQDLSTEEHIAFGRRFGELEVHPFTADNGHDEIVLLDSEGPGPYRANFWHSDVTFRERPPDGSILKGAIIPAVGGDTAWADMERAYDMLDDDTKDRIEHATATHSLTVSFGRIMSAEEQERQLEQFPDQHHPVVRVHPETGRRALFVNLAFVSRIDDMDPDEGAALLATLCDTVHRLELQARFRCRRGSFAMWDNRCTQHYGIVDYEGRRRMERVTLVGSIPQGPAAETT